MKISEAWLREWVNPSLNTEELAETLTMAGLEVDTIEAAAPEFTSVVVGEIMSLEKHPDADKLNVCQVDIGNDEIVQIVCGAQNARAGLKAPAALIGANLPGDFNIKKSKLRGVESFGMLCAESELGLADDAPGLMELAADAPNGIDIREYLALDDRIIEIDLTPNRGDCLSIMGIARELGALTSTDVKVFEVTNVKASVEHKIPVNLHAPSACPRYLGRVIKNINSAANTPAWMVERLRRSGIRSINAVVDITNYVLLELGQPMHGFDLAKIDGEIHVRMAHADEKLTLLDGKSIELSSQDLVIADTQKVLALAGIMGGEDSGVSTSTQDIMLECAFFSPLAIAGRARNYGLHTDSSHRFERGVDCQLQQTAMERATALVLEICGGQAGPVVEALDASQLPEMTTITLRRERIGKLLGVEVTDNQILDILQRLGMGISPNEAGWNVISPSYRFDIQIEEDLIEEIGRVYGYNNIPATARTEPSVIRPVNEAQNSLQDVRRKLIHMGFNEAITYSFVDPKVMRILQPEVQPLKLANPISADLSVMRTTLWAGLIPTVKYNLNRQNNRIRLFESGLRYLPQSDGSLLQEPMLAGVICGNALPEQWSDSTRKSDFYDLKGHVESLLATSVGLDRVTYTPTDNPMLHPGQSATIWIDDQAIGIMGALHPSLQKPLGLSQQIFLFELHLDVVTRGQLPQYAPFSRFPAIRRDLALVAPEGVTAGQITSCIQNVAPEQLQQLVIFDVYRGEGLENTEKSIALGLILQDISRTLVDDEVERIVSNILENLRDKLSVTLRG